MNITKTQVDDLNAIVTVAITKEDYSDKVEKVLADYRKNASVPGFRKGGVPMSLIQKQYGKAVLLDEVNKILQSSLNDYLVAEKLDILGNPLPKVTEDFNWDNDNLSFDFELGLAPQFSVDLTAKSNVTKFNVIADDKMLNEQVERIQKQYGKLISQPEVKADYEVRGTFTNEEKGINAPANFSLDIFADKKVAKAFIGKKVGDVVTVNTKGLFEDDHQLMDYLKVGHDNVHDLAVDVDFTIEAINASEPAELNQELFDKLFGEGNVATLEELKAKIKEDAEAQFAQQADQKLLADVQNFLIDNTKFDLPAEFLKKWLQTVGEKKLSPAEAEVEYARSEKGLRFQLIEGKAMAQSNIQITFEDLKTFTTNAIKQQMAQFGQTNPSDEEVQGIVARVLSNQEEVRRLSDQVVAAKLLELFKEKANPTTKEVTYEEFIAASYGE